MLRMLKFFIVLVIVLAGLAVHLRNDHAVALDYYLGTVEWPLSLFLIGSLLAGVLLGIAVSLPALLRLRHEKARLEAKIRLNERELNNLRVIPVRS